MAQERKKIQFAAVILFFIVYFLAAARPIPLETVLTPRWLSSLQTNSSPQADSSPESGHPVLLSSAGQTSGRLLPFTLGNRFGYVDSGGRFPVNKLKTGDIYLSENQWTEYEAEPSRIEIKDIASETAVNIENPRGYPLLLDGRVFILGSEQNALSEIDQDGNILWTYEFGAPLTCIDAAAGLVLTGSIDGIVEILDSNGKRIFFFEPGGSRYAVILGGALSRNGSRLGIICGIEEQRFLLLERYGAAGGEYKVIYHEFIQTGFRRPVHVLFTDQDRRVIFEYPGGIGCYDIKSRQGMHIPLDGTIAAIDDSGDQGFFFVICSHPESRKELIGIRFPERSWVSIVESGQVMQNTVVLKAPFKSDNVFLGRTGSMLVAGGGTTLVSFDLEKK